MSRSREINLDAFVSDLDHYTLSQVAAPMDEDGSWKDRLLQFCCQMGEFTFNVSEIQNFERIGQHPHTIKTPALALLMHLGNRGMTVRKLLHYLEVLKLQRSQMPLRTTERLVVTHHPLPLIELEEGNTLQLFCQADGFPYPKYRWFINQQLINGADAEHLTIPNVSVHNTGKYICQIYNEKEWVQSRCSLVTVYARHGPPAIPPRVPQPSPQKLHITLHPKPQEASLRECVEFRCEAVGHGPLVYRWHRQVGQKSDAERIVECDGKLLKIQSVTLSHQGFYWCAVSDQTGNTVQTKLVELIVHSSQDGKLQIITEPVLEQSIPIDGRACFEVKIGQASQVEYEWFHDGQLIKPDGVLVRMEMTSVNSCELSVKIKGPADRGRYLCRIKSAVTGEQILSRESQLHILETPTEYKASLKVALLIGVSTYMSSTNLPAVKQDLKLLQQELRNLDFYVITLLDLEGHEIKQAVNNFTPLLCPGVYGVLFLQGHGFESDNGEVFLKPADAHTHATDKCINTAHVLDQIRECRPALAVLMVDVCRTKLTDGKPLKNRFVIHGDRSTVVMYATGSGRQSLERKGAPNGVFVDLLCKAIASGKQDVRSLFMDIQALLKADLPAADRMFPEIKFTLDESRSLHDRVDHTGNTIAVDERICYWQYMHTVPDKIDWKILHGRVDIDIRFALELSNVLRMFLTVKNVSPFDSIMFDVVEYPPEIAQPTCVSQTKGQTNFDFVELQKLRGDLIVKLTVKYKLTDDRMGEETISCDLGKPLVAAAQVCGRHQVGYGQGESRA